MGGKAAIGGGLVMGLLVGAGIVAGVVALAPGPAAPTPAPVAAVSPTPDSSVDVPSPSPTGIPTPSPDPSSAAPSATSSADAFGIGEPAPPLTVPQLGGGEISLAALQGKPVWVTFFATWCATCREELPLMSGFATRYAETGLVVLAIDVKEDEAAVDAFISELQVTFPVGLDETGSAQADWGAYALPVHFWIDAAGIVQDGAQGGIDPDTMARGLQTILPGVTVTP